MERNVPPALSVARIGLFALLLGMVSNFCCAGDEVGTKRPGTLHEVFLERTDYELHVYRVFGKEPGKKILIIGGIHGNEPGGYLAADKYVDLALKRGDLVIVPRANLLSILMKDRGNGGDYNRKFNTELDPSNYEDRVISILKGLIEECDVLLNLHDGSGFYRDQYIDELHNPYRFGQSVIVDCESFYCERTRCEVNLVEVASRVADAVNNNIEEKEYQFHCSNHDSISPDTRYPEMRKTATYFALTNHQIPAFGIETSKKLPGEMRVAHQVLVINEFLREYGIEPDVPNPSVDEPRLRYALVTVNAKDARIVRDGETLSVARGDRITIDEIVGNYERHLYADVVAVGGRNDNGHEFVVADPLRVVVLRDGDMCGEFDIIPRDDRLAIDSLSAGRSTSTGFLIDVNGSVRFVAESDELTVTRGDRMTIIDYVAPAIPEGLNVNFMGYVSDPSENIGEDRGFAIDTASDLLPNWSLDGAGERYALAAKLGSRELARMTVRLVDPLLDWLVIKKNNERPVLLRSGETWPTETGDILTVIDARTTAQDSNGISYSLSDSEGREVPMNDSSFTARHNDLRLAVYRLGINLGTIHFQIGSAKTSNTEEARR